MFETELAALEALYEGIVALPGTIVSAIVACVYLLLYPVVLLVNMGYYWVTDLLGSFVAILGVLYDIGSTLSTGVVGMFSGLPSAWVSSWVRWWRLTWRFVLTICSRELASSGGRYERDHPHPGGFEAITDMLASWSGRSSRSWSLPTWWRG